jgi:hypothetical protein
MKRWSLVSEEIRRFCEVPLHQDGIRWTISSRGRVTELAPVLMKLAEPESEGAMLER